MTGIQPAMDRGPEDAAAELQLYLESLHDAAEVSIDTTKPFKLYLRSAELVYKQACIYCNENDYEKGYVLHMKFSNLVLGQLTRHPEAGRPEFASQRAHLKRLCLKCIGQLEQLKPLLKQQFCAQLETAKAAALQQQAAEQAALQKAALKADLSKSTPSLPSVGSSSSMYSFNALPAAITANDSLRRFHDKFGRATEFETETAAQAPQAKPASQPLVHPAAPQSFVPKYFSENGQALRMVRVPACIIDRFLQLASQNTKSNLETCGVLAGKLQHDIFTITTLIIPKQSATSDTCAMSNEEEIVETQDTLDVLSLGWIHTHPTQKCFLSSVDLHTHMPFQLLMAESIAIVCAPTQTPNFGIFRLTDPPGLDLITKCRHPAAFHPHPTDVNIYRELRGPDSHAQLITELPLEVVDLRNK